MTLNLTNIKNEIVVFLRNQDILTTTQRGVTTANATGTLSGTKVITISRTNVKNIRSIKISELNEKANTGDNSYANHSGWIMQTFTIGQVGTSDDLEISSIKLKLYRVGSPGTITIGIRETSAGKPTGDDLSSATIDGDVITTNTSGEWYTFSFDSGTTLSESTKYAIVLRSTVMESYNRFIWRINTSDPYASAGYATSSDNGDSWGTVQSYDAMFEVWGYNLNTTLSLGKDYTVDYNHANGCVITFGANQTGDYIVSHDYGTDKIYPDFPRDDLGINNYPRIAVDIMTVSTDAFGIGGSQFISDITFTVVVYADDVDDIDGYIQAIKDAMRGNAKLFYYVNFIKPTITGPLINSPDRSSEIMQRNTDFQAMFQEE